MKHPRCVAIGEIGFNNITANEETVFRQQLKLAADYGMLAIVHLPHFNKIDGVRRTIDVIKSVDIPEENVIIDHNTEDCIGLARQTGCYTGMTVYPISKLTPERVSNIVKEYGTDRMIINGSADWGLSDPLSLVKVTDFMRGDGHTEKDIRKILFENPNKFYSRSAKWKPDFGIVPLDPREFQR